MQMIFPGEFQVTDGEVITVSARSTGAPTRFGVNYSIFGNGGPLQEGHPTQITMDKSMATGDSSVRNAMSTVLTLLFNFLSSGGSRYDVTLTGSNGGSFDDFAEQTDDTPKSTPYLFHIV